MVRPQWPYPAAREQTLSDESGGRSGAGEVAGESSSWPRSKSSSERRDADRPPKILHQQPPAESGRGILRKGEMQSENQSPVAAFLFCGALAVTPLDQLRLRLPAHDFDRLMQAAKPVAEPARDALLKDIAAELGQHEVVGPGLLHRIISEVQRRYDVADQRRTTAQKREDPGWM